MDIDIIVASKSINQFVELFMGQNQKIIDLQELMQERLQSNLDDLKKSLQNQNGSFGAKIKN